MVYDTVIMCFDDKIKKFSTTFVGTPLASIFSVYYAAVLKVLLVLFVQLSVCSSCTGCWAKTNVITKLI